MGGSGVTARGNGIRQTSGQWRRGNRAGSPGLEPAKGLATVDRHQGTQGRLVGPRNRVGTRRGGATTISGPWGVVDKGTGKASTGSVGSKHKVKGVALTPKPPAPAGLVMAEGGKVEG